MSGSVMRFVRRAVGPAADGPSDAELLRRFAATRDAGAFELLVWRHAGMVRAAARAVVRDHHLAEDVSQAAFLALAKRAAAVRENPAGWLYRVARRIAARQRRSVGPAVPDVPAPDVRHSRTYEDCVVLHEELAALSDKYRLPLLLCFVEGLSHADAAARLGWPVGTVAGRIARAKDTLRVRLARRGLAPSLAALAVAGSDGPFAAATVRAAVAFAAGEAAGVSPTVLPLVHGALRAMTIAKLKLAAGLVAACGALTAGGVLATTQNPAAPPAPAAEPASQPTNAGSAGDRRAVASLGRVASAVVAYELAHGHYPTDILDPDGKALLSWRVAILPQLGYEELYKRFRLTEPWNSPANRELISAGPPELHGVAADGTLYARCVFLSGPGAAADGRRWISRDDIKDGLANTLGPVRLMPLFTAWSQPMDVAYQVGVPFSPPGGTSEVSYISTLDGAAHAVRSAAVDEPTWRRWVERADGKVGPGPAYFQLRLPAESPAKKADLARLLAENAALIRELEAVNAANRDPVVARRLRDHLKVLQADMPMLGPALPAQAKP